MVKGASGQFEDGVERMVTTPWFDKEISLTEKAAEQGTYKVIPAEALDDWAGRHLRRHDLRDSP